METKDIVDELKGKGIEASYGDSDFSTVIVWEEYDKLDKALEDIKSRIHVYPGAGYAGGTIIVPKDK